MKINKIIRQTKLRIYNIPFLCIDQCYMRNTKVLHQRSMIVEGRRDKILAKNNLRVLALAISLASFGSSQIFLLPHRKMDEASRFCTRSELM